MGGSFDPIHLGHLRAAENAREALSLDEVLFVPAAEPPHKPTFRLSPARDRLAMVALATDGQSLLRAERRRAAPLRAELHRGHPRRRSTQERRGDELFLIVGSDTLGEMASWREPERIFALSTIAVADRPGAEIPPAPLPAGPGGASGRTGPLPLRLRDPPKRVRAGRSVRYLLPDAVAAYIATHGLYS